MTETTDIVSLADLKAHLRVDTDDEDAVVSGMLEASRRHIEAWVGPLDVFESGVPDDLKEAMKMHAGLLYESREAASTDAPDLVPLGYYDLIGPWQERVF
ncbi:phage gp6-like head-tail connector protein [Ancylobacter aquaticus]|nr:phage gp6-like head-tail connector protein [Ancylobacter aquaticus]